MDSITKTALPLDLQPVMAQAPPTHSNQNTINSSGDNLERVNFKLIIKKQKFG